MSLPAKKKSVLNKSYASLSNPFFFLDWHGISVIQITFDDAKKKNHAHTHAHKQTNKNEEKKIINKCFMF